MKRLKRILFIVIVVFSILLGIYYQFDTLFFGVIPINEKYYINGAYYFSYIDQYGNETFIIIGNKVNLLDENNNTIETLNDKETYDFIQKSNKYVVTYEYLDNKILSKPKTLIGIREFNIDDGYQMSIENKEPYVTSYENINLTEALDKISFDVKLPTYIPFEAEGIYSDVDIIKEKGEQIVVHYSRNNDTKDHHLHIIADNVIPAKYNTDTYYSEGSYYQSLVWIEDKINYRLVYFIGDISGGQQPLSEEELMKIAESMK